MLLARILFLLLISYHSILNAQVAKMVPGSTLRISSSTSSSGDPVGCSTGIIPFLHIFRANGWNMEYDIIQYPEKRNLSQKGNEKTIETIYVISVFTVDPASKRRRNWIVNSSVKNQSAPSIYASNCYASAELRGDRIDDSLEIDIGIAFPQNPQRPNINQEVSGFSVYSPRYCAEGWYEAEKATINEKPKSSSCKSIGLDIPAVVQQAENLIQK